MIFLWFIIVILVGAIIGLVIYVTEKPKSLKKEITRLRKSIVHEGKSFEQVEYHIENLKKNITEKKKLARADKLKPTEIIDFLDNLHRQLDEILDKLFTNNSIR